MCNRAYFLQTASNNRFICFQEREFKDNRFEKLQMDRKNCALINQEDEYLANCLVMLSNNAFPMSSTIEKYEVETQGKFQCKSCNKVFTSHQALGGHRASHKKVKGCFASTLDHYSDTVDEIIPLPDVSAPRNVKRKRNKAHECSICHRVFTSGQALGGHKRCHWMSPISNSPTDTSTTASLANFRDQIPCDRSEEVCEKPVCRNYKVFDLNVSPTVNDEKKSLNFEDENLEQRDMKKLKRLSDMRETELDGGGSISWLQMGISSTSTIGGTSPSF